MLPDIKHFQVNWVDGMKISSTDFIALENAFLENVRDVRASRLNEFEYGLLPTNSQEVDNYPKLDFDYTKGELVLKECRAITRGGQRIEITEDNFRLKKFPASQPSAPVSLQLQSKYDVYIFVDTGARQVAGDVAGNNPPRYTTISPKYELSVKLHDERAMVQENYLKISELEIVDGRVNILTSTGKYIPPCMTVSALSSLEKLHDNCGERLNGYIRHYTSLVDKLGDTNNQIALEAKKLIEGIVTPVVSSLSYYKYVTSKLAPIIMVAYFKDYFRFVKFQLERPYQAKIINERKPALSNLLVDFERKEPEHSAILKILEAIKDLLDKLDVFLADLAMYNYASKVPDLIDHGWSDGTRPGPPQPTPPVIPQPLQPETRSSRQY